MIRVENLKTFRSHILSKSTIYFYYKCQNEEEKLFKEEESVQILKVVSLIKII